MNQLQIFVESSTDPADAAFVEVITVMMTILTRVRPVGVWDPVQSQPWRRGRSFNWLARLRRNRSKTLNESWLPDDFIHPATFHR